MASRKSKEHLKYHYLVLDKKWRTRARSSGPGKEEDTTESRESHSILRSSSGTTKGVWRESVVHSAVRAIGPHMVSGKRIKGT